MVHLYSNNSPCTKGNVNQHSAIVLSECQLRDCEYIGCEKDRSFVCERHGERMYIRQCRIAWRHNHTPVVTGQVQ
jgi:hypothetical protein